MSTPNNYLETVRNDERRKRDEADVQTLRDQLGELRQVVRELVSRQLRLEEQVRAGETEFAKFRSQFEQHRHDIAQGAQARQLEEGRVRQQLSELSARIDDSTRPIRSLQAHVAEILETVRRKRDEPAQDTRKYDELRVIIEHLAAHGERQGTVSKSLGESVEAIRTEIERMQRDLLRTNDGVKIVEQEGRRRIAEVAQQIENYGIQILDASGRYERLQSQIEELREAGQEVDPQFETVWKAQKRTDEEIARFQSQAVERDELMAERIEAVYKQLDTGIGDVREIAEQHHERIGQRADKLEDVDRELAYRLNMLEMQIDELRQVDQQLRREVWYLNEQRARVRYEQAQQELEAVIEARRKVENQRGDRRSSGRDTE
jgi:chromosome segregation ATPase